MYGCYRILLYFIFQAATQFNMRYIQSKRTQRITEDTQFQLSISPFLVNMSHWPIQPMQSKGVSRCRILCTAFLVAWLMPMTSCVYGHTPLLYEHQICHIYIVM